MATVADGGLAAMMAGDYFIGAWAMVLLHDYSQGKDFAENGGLRQKLDFLTVIHRDNATRFADVVFRRGATLDFSLYSKTRAPSPGPYDFNLQYLLNSASRSS